MFERYLSMKGDRVEIVIDAGGDTKTYEVTATRAGRRVDVRTGRGLVEVTELTRGGTSVRTARFMASRCWRWSSTRRSGRGSPTTPIPTRTWSGSSPARP